MFCRNCGKEVSDSSSFCPNCGHKLESKENFPKTNHEDNNLILIEEEFKKHECPQCGYVVEAFSSECPRCGFVFKKESEVIKNFLKVFNNAKSIEEKNELISNLYIPNNKKDIIDIFVFAVSQINKSVAKEAWISKTHEILIKAKFCFGTDDDYKYLESVYQNALKDKNKQPNKNNANKGKLSKKSIIILKIVFSIVLGIIGLPLCIVGIVLLSNYGFETPYIWLFALGLLFLVSIFSVWEIKKDKKTEKETEEKSED